MQFPLAGVEITAWGSISPNSIAFSTGYTSLSGATELIAPAVSGRESQRLADGAVCGEPVSAAKNREKYREIWISAASRGSCPRLSQYFRAFLPLRSKKHNRESNFR
jgi:hypothetical protein